MRWSALLALPFLATTALAQAPRITPDGDPSVRNDTIYRLAVDPEAYPEDAVALLLDDGVVRYEADGRGTTTFRSVVQVLKQEAVEGLAEREFSYSPGHQRLTINWIRVVKPDGSVVSEAPTVTRDADVPASLGDPVYTDQKVRRVSLSGVAVGTIVDYSYTLEELGPYMPGQFYGTWSVHTGAPTRRSRYILDVPATLSPRILERNLDFQRTERVAGGRRTYTWVRQDVPKVKPEPYAADSNGIYMSIAVAAPIEWNDIAAWYAGLARLRYDVTPAIRTKLRDVVAGARTRDDSLAAVQRWVAQDIRYVSLSLGIGGYQPRPPREVVASGFGDCKDKATLFIAALRSMGMTAYPVLLNSAGGVNRQLPSPDQFDHAIAAVRRDSGYTFVDLTAELTPFGQIPYGSQGGFGLVVLPDGRGEAVTLPADSIEGSREVSRFVGELSPEGLFTGWYETWASGIRQYGMRNALASPLDSTRRATFIRSLAAALIPGAVGDSLVAFDGKDLRSEPRLAIRLRGGRMATRSGDTEILNLPLQSSEGLASVADELEATGPRRFPIDAERIFGPSVNESELRIVLPEGWRARLPRPVRAESVFGRYTAEFEQVGRELRVRRRMVGARGVLPPERLGELTAWLRAAAQDDVKFIVVERGARG